MSESKGAPTSLKVQVERGTNPRQGSISHYPDEVQQCVLDVVAWFDRNVAESKSDVGNTPEEDLRALGGMFGSALPASLEALLRARGSGVYLHEFRVLTAREMVEVARDLEGRCEAWTAGTLPVGSDVDGNLVVIAKDGRVREWDEAEGFGAVVASTFDSYLEAFREKLLSHQVEFVEGVGAVETRQSPARSAVRAGK